MKMNRNRVWAALAAGVLAALGLTGPMAPAAQAAPSRVMQQASDAPDQLIFKDGRIIEGEVLEETATTVRFLVVVAGIKGEQTYSKADILSIERGVRTEQAKAGVVSDEADRADEMADEEPRDGAPGVYVLELTGQFGRDIAPTPIRNAIKDAAKLRPDYLIVVLDNAWETSWGQELADDQLQQFDQLFQTEDMEPIFTKELPEMLGYRPKIVFWVKNAMGGAAFLPFNFDTIYFSSDGRMGGIGRLEQIFGNTGDERVREKQFSLRLGHARGMANRGGYDTRLIEAMARTEYVLSYRIEAGQAVLVEGMPNTDLGEVLLTDDGQGDNEDNIKELARGQGNDNLTISASIAEILGVSKGTVDDLDDLLYELEIDRNHRMLDGRGERIMKGWDRELESAERSLRELWKRFNEVQVTGDYRERTTGRSTRISILRKIKALLERYEEVYKVGQLRLPPGLPGIQAIDLLIEQLRQEQMKDRP